MTTWTPIGDIAADAVTVEGTDVGLLPTADPLDGSELIPGKQGASFVGIPSGDILATHKDTILGPSGTVLRRFSDFYANTGSAFTTHGQDIDGFTVILSGTGAQASQTGGGEFLGGYLVDGVMQLSTGTTSGGIAGLTRAAGFIYRFSTSDTIRFLCRLRVPTLADGTNTFEIHAGFLSDYATDVVDGGFWFEHRNGQANWRCINRDDSVDTDASSGIAVSTTSYVNLGVEWDGATANFYASTGENDIALVVSQATHAPDANTLLFPAIVIQKSAGTTARTVNVDAMAFSVPHSRGLSLRV
jgi:hypothetical protein